MPQFVVLLRGVNVGKANRVPMLAFREMLEVQGFTDVRTLLNSGNAVFRANGRSTQRIALTISAGLRENMGVGCLVVVKSSAEFNAVVSQNPFAIPEDHYSRFLVVFAQDEAATRGLSALQPALHTREQFHVGEHAAYLYCAGGILESAAGSALLGKLGREITTRNWATVIKLKALLDRAAV